MAELIYREAKHSEILEYPVGSSYPTHPVLKPI